MTLRLINRDAVVQCLPMPDCIDLMVRTQKALSAGDIEIPLRTMLPLAAGRGQFGVMPGEIPSLGAFGAKLLSLFPDNPSAGKPAINGGILLFESHHGAPVALVDAASVTALRTAAASGAATRALARNDACVLGLLGCGVQAVSHLDAMMAVRSIREVRVWGRSRETARAFAEQQSRRVGLPIVAVADARTAVTGADLICTVTGAGEPVLDGEWISPGCHLNCVGAHTPDTREVDTKTILRSRVYVEVMQFALREAGELIIPIEAGDIDESHIVAEIGAVLAHKAPGRESAHDITLYKNLGNPAQDIASAALICRRAAERGLGTEVDF